MLKRNELGLVFIAVSILSSVALFTPVNVLGQVQIYNEEVPEVHLVWTRIADFSPKLRAVEAAELSPDGRHAASVSKFGYKVMLWDAADGSLIWEREHDSEVECVTFSPDGKRVASGGEDYFVRIWDAETGEELEKLEHPIGLDGLAWSYDGEVLACGAEDGHAFLWDGNSYDQVGKIKVGSTINSLAFTRDDKKLLVGGNIQTPNTTGVTGGMDYSGFVKLIDMEKMEVIRSYGSHPDGSIKSVRISSDESMIACGGFGKNAKLYEFESGKELAVFEEPMRIEAIDFTQDGQYLITGGHRKALTFYRLKDYKKVLEVPCPRIDYIDVSNDGRLMLTGHEDSGLLGLYMFLSNLQQKAGTYQRIADQQLNNKDLKKD